MSSYSYVVVNHCPLLPCPQGYLPELAGLFTENELRHGGESLGYLSTVAELRDRLQLYGFTAGRARTELDGAIELWHGEVDSPGIFDLNMPLRDSAEILNELSGCVNSTDEWAIYEGPQDLFLHLDPRTVLRLALDVADNGWLPVRYDLDDLLRYELLVPGTPITDQAREERRRNVATDASLVILTEGSTDSELLAKAIKVTHPHLVGFLRFMDFGSGAEGGAASLAKLVRSFVGAGIANRVLAIADNDTAGHDALAKLKRENLPDGYCLMHYPDLPLLRRYPTLGPQQADPVVMDVNGKAGSLEMYLGQDLLTVGNQLVPVQWIGLNKGQRAYQGAIDDSEKRRIQQEFDRKVKIALQDPAARGAQDWTGVEAIVKEILRAFK